LRKVLQDIVTPKIDDEHSKIADRINGPIIIKTESGASKFVRQFEGNIEELAEASVTPFGPVQNDSSPIGHLARAF
jgi:hypothetical protein